ncbi:hypothetical protein C9374_013869 [Naegleria lovaniensis]|uniref:CHK kinase-like domain-containing protein n=1 Tax=Naegleria lovaniensis TaxID=51637 RepID=A0AA88H0I5_NAELO|nr:uncharacterized protein C9374_013869 [Naegleria lovaniensis]KAG2389309.1 hypothetical protein C9374_013869 [Naegleria lovaniensis]
MFRNKPSTPIVTLEKLQQVLPFGKDISQISSCELVAKQGVVARTYRIELVHVNRDDDDDLMKRPDQILLKTNTRGFAAGKQAAYEKEMNMFRKVLPLLQHSWLSEKASDLNNDELFAPIIYAIDYNMETKTMMIFMEYLETRDDPSQSYQLSCSSRSYFGENAIPIKDKRIATSVLKKLKQLQIAFNSNILQKYGKEKLSSDDFKMEHSIYSALEFLFKIPIEKGKAMGAEAIANLFTKQFKEDLESICDMDESRYPEELSELVQKTRLICDKFNSEKELQQAVLYMLSGECSNQHCSWNNEDVNISVRFIDWQTCGYGNPLADVVNFICQSLDPELQQTMYGTLISEFANEYMNLETELQPCLKSALWFQMYYSTTYAKMFKNAHANLKKEIGSLYDLLLRGSLSISNLLLRSMEP